MLLNLLRKIIGGQQSAAPEPPSAPDRYPNETWDHLARAHAGAPMAKHLGIALGDLRIGDQDLLALTRRCLAESKTKVMPLKALHRPLAGYFLARYFLHAMTLDGAMAECGVCRGTSALFLCHAARTRDPHYTGAGLHLIDSFEGISQPVGEDHYDARDQSGTVGRAMIPQGSLAAPIDLIRDGVRDFPEVQLHQGWIPDVFRALPETRWSFVHIDVDLYEPTRDCLEYFVPRLCAGGVIVCDDYAALMFPGARRAWDQVLRKKRPGFCCAGHGTVGDPQGVTPRARAEVGS